MNKIYASVVVASVLFVGCNKTENEKIGALEKVGEVYHEDGTFFGKTDTLNSPIFATGVYLFNQNERVGFIDTDGIVYKNNYDEMYCGGEILGLCQGGLFDDGILINSCISPSYEEAFIISYDDEGVEIGGIGTALSAWQCEKK